MRLITLTLEIARAMDDAITPDVWRSRGRWLSFNGYRLFVTTVGDGPPVLVLHSFPTASYDFSRLAPLLMQRYRLVLFDYPGFGFSDKPPAYPYSLFTYADAAQVVAQELGLKRLALLAHDIGDSVALELVRRAAPVIERLVLLNGSIISIPLTDPAMLPMQKILLHPMLGTWVSRLGLFRPPVFAWTFRKLFYRTLAPQEMRAFWSLVSYNNGPAIYHLLIRYMCERWTHQESWLAGLQAHRAPLTLIWGQADPVAPPAVAEQTTRLRLDATYTPLAEVGHYPQWESPLLVAKAICEAFG
jgi:pimeloyl-ACP methyl ester carboxylesterase